MRKNLFIVALLLGCIFTACAHGRKTVKKKTVRKVTTVANAINITSVTMRRGACFGKCPEYSITIKNDGNATYSGFRNAEPMGVFEKNIGKTVALNLLKEFSDNRVDTCRAMYTSRIADMPGVYFTFIINGKEKSVTNAQFGPLYFNNLADAVDAAGKPDANWKKISDEAGDR